MRLRAPDGEPGQLLAGVARIMKPIDETADRALELRQARTIEPFPDPLATLHREIVCVQLPRDPTCAATARRLLESHFARYPASALADAKTVASELVNNAFIHGEGAIQLRLAHRENRLRIEVIDDGSGADIGIRNPGARGGQGLRLVDRLARGWGVREGTTHAWAELALANDPMAADGGRERRSMPGVRNGGARQPDAQRARCAPHEGTSATAQGDPAGEARRSKFAVLYLRAAGALERSAQLAERHARRKQGNGWRNPAAIELDRAKGARDAAKRRTG
jgi:anti-sigma regulatory factor (Ser/Thr protein kinase)